VCDMVYCSYPSQASANSNGGGGRDLTSTLKSAVAPPIEGVEGLAKLTGKDFQKSAH